MVAILAPIAASRADTQWIGSLSGSWFDSANWSEGIPNTSIDAVIDSGIAAVPANPSAAGALRLSVGATNSGLGALLGVSGNQLGSIYLTIGRDAGSSGLVSFTQAATALNLGSTIVGGGGSGVLTVEGASEYALRTLSVGLQTGSTGTVIINGTGSAMRLFEANPDFESFADIGSEGTGVVEVKDGASFAESGSDLYLTLGSLPGGNGRITASGAGSLVDAYDIQAGIRSQGTLQAQAGALLTARTISLGSGSGGAGALSVSGAGSKATAATLKVGSALGSGQVSVENGGILQVTNLVIGSGVLGAPGSIKVRAAEIKTTSFQMVDGLASTLRLEPGGVIRAEGLSLTSQSRIEFQLAGLSNGLAEKVLADNIVFDGVFSIELADGYVPELGNTFDLFDFTSVSGQFDSFSLAPLPSGLSWDIGSLSTTGELRVVPEPEIVVLMLFGMALLLERVRRCRPV
jgi:T5SS/PEP-CTERM-associated repeat protein